MGLPGTRRECLIRQGQEPSASQASGAGPGKSKSNVWPRSPSSGAQPLVSLKPRHLWPLPWSPAAELGLFNLWPCSCPRLSAEVSVTPLLSRRPGALLLGKVVFSSLFVQNGRTAETLGSRRGATTESGAVSLHRSSLLGADGGRERRLPGRPLETRILCGKSRSSKRAPRCEGTRTAKLPLVLFKDRFHRMCRSTTPTHCEINLQHVDPSCLGSVQYIARGSSHGVEQASGLLGGAFVQPAAGVHFQQYRRAPK